MSTYADANPYLKKIELLNTLTPKQEKFVKEKIKGHTNKDAALIAGYSQKSAQNISSSLLKNEKIVHALEKRGFTDDHISEVLDTAINAGLGQRATNSDALKGIEMVAKLKGHLKQNTENNSQTNVFINELNQMSDESLAQKVAELTTQIQAL